MLNFVRIFVSNDLLVLDSKLYYVGKSKKDKRLVILDKEEKRQIFEDCHGSTTEGVKKIESLFFWREMVNFVSTSSTTGVCKDDDEKGLVFFTKFNFFTMLSMRRIRVILVASRCRKVP